MTAVSPYPHLREVDIGACDMVDVVGQHMECNGRHDFNDGGVVNAGGARGGHIGFAHQAARFGRLQGKVQHRVGSAIG